MSPHYSQALTTLVYLRAFALVYFWAFASLYVQLPGAFHDEGLTPISVQMKRHAPSSAVLIKKSIPVSSIALNHWKEWLLEPAKLESYRQQPSVFWWFAKPNAKSPTSGPVMDNWWIDVICFAGMALSLLVLCVEWLTECTQTLCKPRSSTSTSRLRMASGQPGPASDAADDTTTTDFDTDEEEDNPSFATSHWASRDLARQLSDWTYHLLFAALWLLYLSFLVLGGPFLSFQWDILLVEAGFLTIFIAPRAPPAGYSIHEFVARSPRLQNVRASTWSSWGRWLASYDRTRVSLFLIRWLLFRLMFAAGVVKLSSQCPTWWGLTALHYHYYTQCIPAPLSWHAHQLTVLGWGWFHQLSVAATLVIEIVLPLFFLSGIRFLRIAVALAEVALMLLIFATGNYNFFNVLTIVLCLPMLDDDFLRDTCSCLCAPLRFLAVLPRCLGLTSPSKQSKRSTRLPNSNVRGRWHLFWFATRLLTSLLLFLAITWACLTTTDNLRHPIQELQRKPFSAFSFRVLSPAKAEQSQAALVASAGDWFSTALRSVLARGSFPYWGFRLRFGMEDYNRFLVITVPLVTYLHATVLVAMCALCVIRSLFAPVSALRRFASAALSAAFCVAMISLFLLSVAPFSQLEARARPPPIPSRSTPANFFSAMFPSRELLAAAYHHGVAFFGSVGSLSSVQQSVAPFQYGHDLYARYGTTFHLSSPYGLFRRMTTYRREVILQGRNDDGPWVEFEFKYKPGDVYRSVPLFAPHQARLDWQMWFAALGSYEQHPFILHLAIKLLLGSEKIHSLLAPLPAKFASHPPKYVRAVSVQYNYTDVDSTCHPLKLAEENIIKCDRVWERSDEQFYMPELYLHHSEVPNILRQLGWTTTLRQVQESHSPQVLRPSVQRRLQSTRLLTSWLDQQVGELSAAESFRLCSSHVSILGILETARVFLAWILLHSHRSLILSLGFGVALPYVPTFVAVPFWLGRNCCSRRPKVKHD